MDCRHWWVIESPDGRKVLPGECKWCGERREFFCGGTDSDFAAKEGNRKELGLGGSDA